MRVAVLTLTRDRLEYTKHCFGKLREYAGCEYEHFVLDQGSTDGTADWLANEWRDHDIRFPTFLSENIGISAGMNHLLERAMEYEPDVVVKFDNDCELTQPDTLKTVAELANEGAILSPRILGLRNPPAHTRELEFHGERILDVPQIGGIFLAAPAWVYDEFRYGEQNPLWGGDDEEICWWFRRQGGTCGYVKRLEAWHYETTDGQHAAHPAYFARTLAEGKPSLV